MKFDFDLLTRRRGTGSMKWDEVPDKDVIPLWVADMDFRTAPAVTDAVVKRAQEGIFGYTYVDTPYYDALCHWFYQRHQWGIDRNMVIYTSGVVPALSAIIKALARNGDKVILQTPAYNCFFSSIRNNKTLVAENPLRRIETAEGFTYEIDFDHLELLASDPGATLMILCNPHNPTGRVWTRDELLKVRDICQRNNVTVISDEIHCELTRDSRCYVPYATVDKRAVVCTSPSKSFNTAGLQIANIIAPDDATHARIDRAINDNEVCDVNPFGVLALQAAYNDGREWLDALNKYLDGNLQLLRETFATQLPSLKTCDSESTYLAWIDISPLHMTSDEVAAMLENKAKVKVSSGSIYNGDGYIRINYACPRRRLEEALGRIVSALRAYQGSATLVR